MADEAFACPRCGQPVTSSAAPGQRVSCPRCGGSFKLPEAVRSRGVAAEQSANETSSVTETAGRQIAFACPLCDTRLYASPEQERIVCPDCLESVEVPAAARSNTAPPTSPDADVELGSDPPATTHPASELEFAPVEPQVDALTFDDDEDLPLAEPGEMPGRASDSAKAAPDSTSVGPTENISRAPSSDDDDELKLAPLDPLPDEVQSAATFGLEPPPGAGPPTQPGSAPPVSGSRRRKVRRFGITCGVCDTRLDVSEDDIGTTVICPDCDTPILVEPPPPEKKLAEVDWDAVEGDELKLAEAEPLDVYKEMAVEAEARAEKEEEEELKRKRKTPTQLPRNPLKTNVFRCFAHWRAWAFVAAIAAADALFLGAVALSASIGEENAVAGTLLGVVIGGSTAVIAGVVSGYFGAVVLTDSAEGWDEFQELAPFDFWEWLGEAIFVAMAVVYSLLPVSLLAILSAVGLPAWVIGIGSILSWFALFPIVLLSMLENASLAGPYSRKIWSSLRRHPRPWKWFYGLAAGIVIPVALLTIVPLPGWLLPLLAVAMAVVTVAYFRILGRLAWWLASLD